MPFLCGDFNINILSHIQHCLTDSFLDILHIYGLPPLITKEKGITCHLATLLHNVFTNVPLNGAKIALIINGIIHHLHIFLQLLF